MAATAAPKALRRPNAPAKTISMRPVSSSARITFTAASSPQAPAKIARIPPARHAV
jgi:hypothetical protein